VGFLYSFTSTNLSNVFGLPLSTTGSGRIDIGSLTPAFTYYSLDRLFDPRSGQMLFVGTEVAGRGLGGDLNYARPFLDYRIFRTLGHPVSSAPRLEDGREPRVFGMRFRAAHIVGFGAPFNPEALSSIDGIPIFKRYFLGGPDQVRGYALNSVSPLATVKQFLVVPGQPPALESSDIRPIGGDSEVIFNTEYRVPIKWRFSAAVFFDIGASFSLMTLRQQRFVAPTTIQPEGTPAIVLTTVDPLGPGQGRLPIYRASVGGELRFQVPYVNVPLRLILAYNPNAQRSVPPSALLAPERRVAFIVSFGRTL
jgi:outer membrane protein assembly factor BamA